jgi:WD40 repeat protein
LVTVKSSKGDYDGDGFDDFFYTTFFHEEGTSFDLAMCFFRDSKSDKITSLTFDKNNKSILSSEVSNIEVLKINKGSFEANYNVIHPFVMERKFKIKFSIIDNIIKLTQKDIKKANDYFNEMDEGFQQGQERWGEVEEEY